MRPHKRRRISSMPSDHLLILTFFHFQADSEPTRSFLSRSLWRPERRRRRKTEQWVARSTRQDRLRRTCSAPQTRSEPGSHPRGPRPPWRPTRIPAASSGLAVRHPASNSFCSNPWPHSTATTPATTSFSSPSQLIGRSSSNPVGGSAWH